MESLTALIDSPIPTVRVATIIAPSNSPVVINLMASGYLTPNSQATNDPLHPPLPGIGSITNVTRNIAPIVSNLWECLARVLANIFSKMR